ncbi:Crp/Fnr family transcriptional regulator [Rubellimicrobium roseum]|uniref:Crp/Fnr family transcriptional regulator n=1 Tax=Rubellimicrobium roseum TaxID=687525 RepID=A0A5C4N5Z7_9RHOB|nr:Crp/Fnr family transcriptional regulator [Rubellimicrobium roseum]TNC63126.1 Crp/Fnr family transcriptional regulator [Rubellimicrobium roseum]
MPHRPWHMIVIMSAIIAQIFEPGALRRLAAGEALFHAGDRVRLMFLVTEGQVSLLRPTAAGSPLILQRSRPGQVLAEASAYSPHYHCDAQASGEATLLTISVKQFRERLLAEPALADAWAAHLAHAVQEARLQAEIRTLRTTAERLDAWLGEGRALPAKGQWQDLAAELGVTREALYRELAKRRSLDVR